MRRDHKKRSNKVTVTNVFLYLYFLQPFFKIYCYFVTFNNIYI